MEFTATGVVIREKDSGENDRILTVLTKEYGKVTALAKGVRKAGSKNGSACQLFAYCEFDFMRKNSSTTVKRAVSKNLFFGIRNDLERLALACYFADIVDHITYENSNDDEILRLFLNTLYALAELNDLPAGKIKGAFEYKAMCLCGFEPILDFCAECGCEFDMSKNASYIFSLDNGGVYCKDCEKKLVSGGRDIPCSVAVSASLLKVLIEIASLPVNRYLFFNIDASLTADFNFFCERYILHKTERGFNTLKIYKDISNSLSI